MKRRDLFRRAIGAVAALVFPWRKAETIHHGWTMIPIKNGYLFEIDPSRPVEHWGFSMVCNRIRIYRDGELISETIHEQDLNPSSMVERDLIEDPQQRYI